MKYEYRSDLDISVLEDKPTIVKKGKTNVEDLTSHC